MRVQNKHTLQLGGCRYFPVTYCSSECLASGASEGCVMAASVTSPHTDTDTTSMPPGYVMGFNATRLDLPSIWIVPIELGPKV